ncbi:MAG: DUF2065 domain-containing protein [Hyphomicrobiales bacterium]
MTDLIVGIAIALAIEGVVYALFPDQMKAMMAQLLTAPSSSLRTGGVIALAIGVLIVWMVRG